jgi:CHAD domain-containing protein
MRRFTLTDAGDLDRLVDGLVERAGLEREAPRTIERTLYDTFDWRLFNERMVLELQRDRRSASSSLVWRSVDSGDVLGRIDTDDVPRFVWDLPQGPTSDRLGEVVEMRALLPLISVETTRTVLRAVDDQGKTVGRVVVDIDQPKGRAPLGPLIEVIEVRGYEGRVDQVTALLDAQVLVRPAAADGLVRALDMAGYEPGSYSSKLRLRLDPGAPAIESWIIVLRSLLATLVANEAGMRDDLDSEFLHDYRVAVRRTRSVLAQGHHVLPPAVLDRFRPEFAWLGQATGPTRDFDVFLLTLPDFASVLPPDRRNDLKPFHAFLEHHQRQAHVALVAELDTARYATLLRDWRAFLDVVPGEISEPDSRSPTVSVAAKRIRKAHANLIRDGRAIDDASHPEHLHELRKDAKKLRYLLECFGSVFSSEAITPVVKELKLLQDVLGEYQDCQVQVGSLERFGQQMLDEQHAPAAALMALGFVVEQLVEREHRARSSFDERFSQFDSKPVRRAITAMVRTASAAEARL